MPAHRTGSTASMRACAAINFRKIYYPTNRPIVMCECEPRESVPTSAVKNGRTISAAANGRWAERSTEVDPEPSETARRGRGRGRGRIVGYFVVHTRDAWQSADRYDSESYPSSPDNIDGIAIKVYPRYEKLRVTLEALSFVISHEIAFEEIKARLTDTSHSGRSSATMPICSEFELRYLDTRVSILSFPLSSNAI
ncbi:hypothetical protein ALC57_17346 [Trachymyrmex cornetzi]|uniref:Uncharacterized protein n=1 Tax=Trachymyrmex cornetzi TaxID=471704 RepID=A0A195DE86_9HYME|nr:hypothetical protein ALC57_17346 [Trachymyrmex cornetzi]